MGTFPCVPETWKIFIVGEMLAYVKSTIFLKEAGANLIGSYLILLPTLKTEQASQQQPFCKLDET